MTIYALPISVATLLLAAPTDAPELRVAEPPASLNLDPFYKKCIQIEGLPIVSSEKASDYALKEAAYLIGQMLEGRKDVIDMMAKNKVHVAVMAYSERTVDIPEHANMKPAPCILEPAGLRGLGGRTTKLRRGEPARLSG